MTIKSQCAGVRALASLYVDDRLGEGVRRDMEAHVTRCPACQGEVQGLQDLSRRTRELPVAPLEDGFAARTLELARATRTTAPLRSGGSFWPRLRPLAAGVLLLLALAGSYWMGREHGDGEDATDGMRISSRSSDLLVRPVRAARGLASDLGVIDRIPEALQRPILRAQLEHFDLVDWAEREAARPRSGRKSPHRGLATLVLDVESSLEAGASRGRLRELQARVLQEDFWKEALVLPGGAPERASRGRRRAVVATVGNGLPAEFQDALDILLSVKESYVEGRVGLAVTLSRDLEHEMPDLRSVIQVSLARCLGEAGLVEGVEPLLETLDLDMPKMSRVLRMTLGSRGGGLRGFGGLRDIRSGNGSIFFGHGPDGASFRVLVTPDPDRRER